jgi:hypothetical protein
MNYISLQLDPCILCRNIPEGIIILNPFTNSNEVIFYPLDIHKLYYYQTLVSAYYKIVVGHLISSKQQYQEDDSTDLEENDDNLIQIKRENDRLKQQSRDLQRHNQLLRRDLVKMDPAYDPPKIPKVFRPGTVTFPPGFEVDESLDIQFGSD